MEDHTPRKSIFEKYSKFASFLTVIVICFILDITVTGVYHIIKYGSIDKKKAETLIRKRHSIFHHALAPNMQVEKYKWGDIQHKITTNSLGFKDQTIRSINLTSQRPRIVFMGDSFTEGVGLDYEETFVGILDKKFSLLGIDVLNAAVVSYSPAIYYVKTRYLLEEVGLQFSHLIVMIDISDIEDEAVFYEIQDGKVVRIAPSESTTIIDWLLKYTTIPANVIRPILKYKNKWETIDPGILRTEEERQYAVNIERARWTIDDKLYKKYGSHGVRNAILHMNQLHELVSKFNISLTVAVYPWPDQIMNKDIESRQVKIWKDWARKLHVNFVNLFPAFISSTDDPQTTISNYFIPRDVHWNEYGHDLVANELEMHLILNQNSLTGIKANTGPQISPF